MISEAEGKLSIRNFKSRVKFQIWGHFGYNLNVLLSLERQRSTTNILLAEVGRGVAPEGHIINDLLMTS